MAEVPALRRSVGILRHLGSSLRPISAGALARTLDIPRSSLYDLLAVLEELDMVRKVDTGYVLGSGISELDAAHSRHASLQRRWKACECALCAPGNAVPVKTWMSSDEVPGGVAGEVPGEASHSTAVMVPLASAVTRTLERMRPST